MSVDDTLSYLRSQAALDALEADAYWPKWTNPFWHMLVLEELGLAGRIPVAVAEALARSMRRLLPTFPLDESELPAGVDPVRGVPCHCQLGNAYRLLRAAGVDPDAALPWVRPWFLRYQLPDGGLNCDEAAYRRPTPRSSFLSTLPALEAILSATRPLSDAERLFLARGARWLTDRGLFRSLSKRAVARAEFLLPCFPRFYDYDVLRGLRFLARYASEPGADVPRDALEDALAIVEDLAPGGVVRVGRQGCASAGTRAPTATGAWARLPDAFRAPLLDEVSRVGEASVALTREWAEVRAAFPRA